MLSIVIKLPKFTFNIIKPLLKVAFVYSVALIQTLTDFGFTGKVAIPFSSV
ncbi:hypothetical protein QFZ37_002237 [Chryseobacterium ginsenosidimutans]|nr:hypothetical protein [Chryseobacterium ginsenosidimutans]